MPIGKLIGGTAALRGRFGKLILRFRKWVVDQILEFRRRPTNGYSIPKGADL
jgi:hypothetical protein